MYLSTGRCDTKQPEADDVINVLKRHSANKGLLNDAAPG